MKNLATSKNDICLIAGSGLFVYEVANFLNNKNGQFFQLPTGQAIFFKK